MEANDFVVKIKANGSDRDLRDIVKIYAEYRTILANLPTKDRGSFSLNVLCILCRNLDKVPTWRDSIEAKGLLTLSVDCVRETRCLKRPEQVKTLACIYHIHRYVVRQNTSVPPELILKLSFMPFETDSKNLLTEYCKTYWNIIVDRLTYIEKLKGRSVHKLLPKLLEDVIKVIDIYDTVQFCTNILTFLIKKLHSLHNESNSEQLTKAYIEIFKRLSSKSDLASFEKLSDKEVIDVYVKLNDCFYVVTENAVKVRFKDSALNVAVRTGLTLLGHRSDIFHCLQTFYQNSFCCMFENNSYIDTVLKNIIVSCEMTKKLGYNTAMMATYPYLNQFLRVFIEYSVNNSLKDNFKEQIQENCLKLMLHFMSELKNCDQILKCENCCIKTGHHDSLRLSFLIKHFISNSLNYDLDLTNLKMLYNRVIIQQYEIMSELKSMGCVNHEKCFRKLQIDTHNTAILLNKSQKYEFSIELFEMYLKSELNSNEIDHKNISRALYNKGICELDSKLFEESIMDAFLSLIFSKDLKTDKYMSLVMDAKAKSLKAFDEEDQSTGELQLLSAYEACKMAVQRKKYGDLKPFLSVLKFSDLLKHEYTMYVKLWPTMVPIAGIWRSFHQLASGRREDWIADENEDVILWTLFEIISETPSVVRTIHNNYFKNIVSELLDRIEKMLEPTSSDIRVMQTTLLFLKAEFDLTEAAVKHGWKATEPTMDPDLMRAIRTMPQEHAATERAIEAVEIWTELALDIGTVTKMSCLRHSLQLAEIFVQQLLHLCRTAHALQLAHICCLVAKHLDDKESYVRNVGVLLYHTDRQTDAVQDMAIQASRFWPTLVGSVHTMETAIIFLSDVAIYYSKCGGVGAAARAVQLAQTRILEAYDKYPDLNLELAVGRLLEAQTALCKDSGPSTLSAVNGTQRHYLSVASTGPKWSSRRLRSCVHKYHRAVASCAGARAGRALRLARRARSAAGAALLGASATTQALLYSYIVNTHKMDDAQVKIDNRLKYILGLQEPTDLPTNPTEAKIEAFTPKQDIETMLESNMFKKSQLSPLQHCKIPAFQPPKYLNHTNCSCHGCQNINTLVLTCLTTGLEASMYFRANEFDIAENYFNGAFNIMGMFENKLKNVLNAYTKMEFEDYIVDSVRRMHENEFRRVQLEVLIEAAFFELRMSNFDAADDHIVSIHEILEVTDRTDPYLRNEVMNLMIASAKVRNVVKKADFDLETEFENLKLSPGKSGEIPKTPESKPLNVQAVPKIVVKDEDIPKKRKVIKLNLDEGSSDEKDEKTKERSVRVARKPDFKMPGPITSKPVLETITPRVIRKPDILVTDTTETPKPDKNNEFLTPSSTPEQFFTPMTSVKTYSKSLRRGIVKNLEQEFATPKAEKENAQLEAPSRSRTRNDKERSLKRATSPGKLETESAPRATRRQKPASLKLNVLNK